MNKKLTGKKARKAKPRKMSRALHEQLQRAYDKGYRDGRSAEAMGRYRDWT